MNFFRGCTITIFGATALLLWAMAVVIVVDDHEDEYLKRHYSEFGKTEATSGYVERRNQRWVIAALFSLVGMGMCAAAILTRKETELR